jgi:hypothetical protein
VASLAPLKLESLPKPGNKSGNRHAAALTQLLAAAIFLPPSERPGRRTICAGESYNCFGGALTAIYSAGIGPIGAIEQTGGLGRLLN